jgi:hypothetical protein
LVLDLARRLKDFKLTVVRRRDYVIKA